MTAAEARTATIVVTDLADSTKTRVQLGEDQADRLRRAHDALLTEHANAHGGSVIKGLGDGLLVAFAGAAEALAAAVAMQQELDAYARAEGQTMAMRVGIGAGDVSFEQSDCFGTPVIEAARLCDVAEPGAILLADMVRLLARGRSGLSLTERGAMTLKGLPEPIDVWELDWEPLVRQATPLRTKTPYVGREREREQLRTQWDAAVDGAGGLVLIAGEPGIGKTRLVTELSNTAVTDAGGITLFGGCHDGDVVANAPFVEAITAWVRANDAETVATVLGVDAPVIARMVPAVADVLTDVAEPVAVSPDAETARLRDAVSQALLRLSAIAPVLLVVDDLHWADDATVGMLRAAARTARNAPLLVVGTYRETDVDRRHPFAQALGVLQREVEPLRIALDGLDAGDVQALLERLAEHAVPEEFAAMLATETEGNPFFLRETLRHLVDEGELRFEGGTWSITGSIADLGIPAGIRDVIGRRLSRLSDSSNRLLAAGALFEVAFPLPVAADVVDLDDDEALAAIDEALQAGIVRASDEFDHYLFTHALFRHTLVEELNPSRQVRMHRAIATAIEKRLRGEASPSEAAALTRHYHRSAALPNAELGVPFALLVADDAARRYARHEEYDALGVALELVVEGDDVVAEVQRRRAEAALHADVGADTVLREAQRAAEFVAETENADAACDLVAELARRANTLDNIQLAWQLSALGRRWLRADRRDATWCILRAAELSEREYADPENPGIPLDTADRDELREVAKRLPASELVGVTFGGFESRAAAEEYYDLAIAELADAVEATPGTVPVLKMGLVFCLWPLGRPRDAAELLDDVVREQLASGVIPVAVFDLAIVARMRGLLGEFEASEAALTQAFSLLPRIADTSNASFQVVGAYLLQQRMRGSIVDSEAMAALSTWDGSPDTRWAWTVVVSARGLALAFEGRAEEARQVFDELLPIAERAGGWVPNYGLLLENLVTIAWLTENTDGLDLLERNLRAKVVEPDVRYPECDGRWSLALVCALDGRIDEAREWFDEARRVLTEQETWPLIVGVDHDEALMNIRLGAAENLTRADALIESARARCTHPAMEPWLARLDELSGRAT